jgi:cobalt transporter subunit CbtB
MVDAGRQVHIPWGALAFGLAFALFAFYILAFDQGLLFSTVHGASAYDQNVLHELVHDARHAAGFPCH